MDVPNKSIIASLVVDRSGWELTALLPCNESKSKHLITAGTDYLRERALMEILTQLRVDAEKQVDGHVAVVVILERGGPETFGVQRLLEVKGIESHLVDGPAVLPALLNGETLLEILRAQQRDTPGIRPKVAAAELAAEEYGRKRVRERLEELKTVKSFLDPVEIAFALRFVAAPAIALAGGYGVAMLLPKLNYWLACAIISIIIPPILFVITAIWQTASIKKRLGGAWGLPGIILAFILDVIWCATLAAIFVSVYLIDAFRSSLLIIMSNPFFIVPAIASGAALYLIRAKYLAAYGFSEVGAAIMSIVVVVSSPSHDLLTKGLGLLGGLYIFVRGLDNINKGLTPETRERLFATFQQIRKGSKT